MSDKRVTISDIARESGASPTTVSLVLRDKGGIGTETRERVLAAAQTLGYERKATRREPIDPQWTVALLFRAHSPYPEGGANGVNPFYSWVLTGVEAMARARRINLLYGTITIDDSNRMTDIPYHLLKQDLDGVILVGAFGDAEVEALIPNAAYPLVVVDGPGPSSRHDAVSSNNVGGAKMATEHLIAAGHSRIGLITRPGQHNPNFFAREQGYREAMATSGLTPVVAQIAAWNVAAAVSDLLEREPALTAIFCVNDQFALDAFHALGQRGVTVPTGISLVGFDNTDHANAMRPNLTTMHVDKVSMGRFAITLLDQRLQWPDAAPATVVLAPRLILRGSVGPPRTL